MASSALFFFWAVFFLGSVLVVRAGDCECPNLSSSRHSPLHKKQTSNVFFEEARGTAIGKEYKRPKGNPTVYSTAINKKLEASSGCEAEQVHLSLGNEINSVLLNFASNSFESKVYWATQEDSLKVDWDTLEAAAEIFAADFIHNLVDPSMGQPRATEEEIRELQDTSDWAFDPKTGEHYFNWDNVTEMEFGFGHYNNPDMYYQAPLLHTIEMKNLAAGQLYYYRVSDSCTIYRFRMPQYFFSGAPESEQASVFPYSIGLTGDLGQTEVSLKSMEALAALEADAVFLVGDLSYADGYGNSWDTFGRAFEALASEVPVLTTGGNHEVGSGEAWMPYSLRYPTPYQGSGSPDPAYWGREVGPVHVIALNAYSDSSNTSLQFRWLEDYLETYVNRARTPWVLVMVHAAWYCSNTVHWKEAERMRLSMEPMLYAHGVDIVLSGHVHAYERTLAVYQEELDDCGVSYLVLGDGGNYEAEVTPWREDSSTETGAPQWSAFRESSFGVGELTIVNDTHAYYSWHRHACGSDSDEDFHMNFSSSCYSPGDNSPQKMETSDETWFIRPDAQSCPNRHFTTSHEVYPQADSSSNDNDDADDDAYFDLLSKNALFAIAMSLMVVCVALLLTISFLWSRLTSREADFDSLHNGDYKSIDEQQIA